MIEEAVNRISGSSLPDGHQARTPLRHSGGASDSLALPPFRIMENLVAQHGVPLLQRRLSRHLIRYPPARYGARGCLISAEQGKWIVIESSGRRATVSSRGEG